MKKSKALSAISLLTVLMVFGFQNCSKVDVQDMPSMNGKVVSDGDGAAIDMGEDPMETPDIAVGEPHPDKDKDKDKDCDKDDGGLVKMPSETDLRALCLKEKTGGIAGPVIEHLRGITIVESDELERVEDVRGILVIRGKTAGAKLKMLKNTRGALVVCGMEVEDIDDTRGQMVLVNSKAAHVNNVRGNINLIQSEIGDLKDFRGVIKEDGKKPVPVI